MFTSPISKLKLNKLGPYLLEVDLDYADVSFRGHPPAADFSTLAGPGEPRIVSTKC